MDIIEKVSINGVIFMLDSAAHATLNDYLVKIKTHYETEDGGNEIVEGIESRIAELLEEKTKGRQVVSKADIDSIINIMGMPEEMDSQEQKKQTRTNFKDKRLYRDPKHGLFGGVCSGLANYLGTDVVLVRMIFVGLFALSWIEKGGWIFSVPLTYLALMICMPAARTVRQQWEMKGEDGSLDSVEKSVKSGAVNVPSETRTQFWSNLGDVILYCIGFVMLIIGVAGMVAGIVMPLAFSDTGWFGEALHDMQMELPMYYSLLDRPWIMVCTAIVYMVPFLGLLLGGIQICFKFKAPSWRPGLILFLLWLAAVIALISKIIVVALTQYI